LPRGIYSEFFIPQIRLPGKVCQLYIIKKIRTDTKKIKGF
jgi:hypothetical protein